ncbi:MAG: PilZ domain-containing protein [Polyangiaceae bacterium]|nr:PilZ domain-containing protein [Polyangiaceae bacterium]
MSAEAKNDRTVHFRAHARKPVRLNVGIDGFRSNDSREAVIVDVSIAGAGLETNEPLAPGERILVSFQTPALWDPLVVSAVVAWAQPPRAAEATLQPTESIARAGVTFDYATPADVLAMHAMLDAL